MDDMYTSQGRAAGRNTPATPPPGDIPVTPLPPIVGEPETGPGGVPEIPLPPIVGQPPAANPDQIPVVPLPPIVGNPDTSWPIQPPASPGPGGIIVIPGIVNPNYCTVRFLNAAGGYDPLRVTVGNRLVSNGLSFGALTNYGRVADGFRTVTISNPSSPATSIFYQQTIPFQAGEVITLAIIKTNFGLDLLRISDFPCRNQPTNRACIRAVNLCYQSPPLDFFLNDGRMVFSDVPYRDVTAFRQARPRDYGFYITQTAYVPSPYFSDIETLDDVPVVAPNYYIPGHGGMDPVVSFYVNARRGGTYTIYVLGNWTGNPGLRVKVVEDFY